MKKAEREVLEKQIVPLYGTMPAKDIAKMFNVKIDFVYRIGRKHGKSQPQNKEIIIGNIAEQIILSGIIGDGRLRKNGKNKVNTYYSECHANDELDYLKWKFDNLGNLTENSKIYGKNMNKETGEYEASEFNTLTTPSLNKYFDMSKTEVLSKLDELGLLLLILDDGWTWECKSGIRVSLALMWELTDKDKILLQKRYYDILGMKSNIYYRKERSSKHPDELSFPVSESDIFTSLYRKYLSDDIDIGIKKLKGF